MPVYTVHGPVTDSPRPAADRIVFVRDGFSFWAFLLGPFWLIGHRLWWALLGYVVLMIAIGMFAGALGWSSDVKMLVNLLIAVLMGLEAASLRRWTLSRRRWRQLDVVAAKDQDAAEQRFFDRYSGLRHHLDTPEFDAHDRGAPPPSRAPAMRAAPSRDDIIGLFPQPGGASR